MIIDLEHLWSFGRHPTTEGGCHPATPLLVALFVGRWQGKAFPYSGFEAPGATHPAHLNQRERRVMSTAASPNEPAARAATTIGQAAGQQRSSRHTTPRGALVGR
jgi:hypothetical protein